MRFYSYAKFLISGEYLVLKGATALATPLKFGQSLDLQENSNNKNLLWESFIHDELWFSAEFDAKCFDINRTTDRQIANKLMLILQQAKSLNPDFLKEMNNIYVKTNLDFDVNWGMGSSSTLISNIAYWANVDQFVLHKNSSNGSGYDVICARQSGPILFELSSQSYSVDPVIFNPAFKDDIYFIYLGQKQDSSKSVMEFKLRNKSYKFESNLISELSKHIANSENLNDFEYYIKEHEDLISNVLKKRRIKDTRFKGHDGEVKSLGAWGGDFAMITWQGRKNKLVKYLKDRNIDVVYSFDEIIRTAS